MEVDDMDVEEVGVVKKDVEEECKVDREEE